MTLTAIAQPASELHSPRVRLELDAGVGNTFVDVTITRSGRPLSRSVPPDGVQQTFTYDYEAPFRRLVTYVATGTTTAGSYSSTATVSLDEPYPWLIHPTLPGLSVALGRAKTARVHLSTKATATRTMPRAVLKPPARDRAVVYPLGPRSVAEWDLVLDTHQLAERDRLLALLSDGSTLLLRVPQGHADGRWDLPDGWYAVGDDTEARFGMSEMRRLTLPMIPAAEPPVQLAPPFTWGDLALGYTWGDILGNTWLNVIAGEV